MSMSTRCCPACPHTSTTQWTEEALESHYSYAHGTKIFTFTPQEALNNNSMGKPSSSYAPDSAEAEAVKFNKDKLFTAVCATAVAETQKKRPRTTSQVVVGTVEADLAAQIPKLIQQFESGVKIAHYECSACFATANNDKLPYEFRFVSEGEVLHHIQTIHKAEPGNIFRQEAAKHDDDKQSMPEEDADDDDKKRGNAKKQKRGGKKAAANQYFFEYKEETWIGFQSYAAPRRTLASRSFAKYPSSSRDAEEQKAEAEEEEAAAAAAAEAKEKKDAAAKESIQASSSHAVQENAANKAPPPAVLADDEKNASLTFEDLPVNYRIFSKWPDDGQGRWYAGYIAAVHKKKEKNALLLTYDIKFNDGDELKNIARTDIRGKETRNDGVLLEWQPPSRIAPSRTLQEKKKRKEQKPQQEKTQQELDDDDDTRPLTQAEHEQNKNTFRIVGVDLRCFLAAMPILHLLCAAGQKLVQTARGLQAKTDGRSPGEIDEVQVECIDLLRQTKAGSTTFPIHTDDGVFCIIMAYTVLL